MPNYGSVNLEKFSEKCTLSSSSVLSLGLKILEAIQLVHKAGYVYKDLKLDNLVVMGDHKRPKDVDLTLVDFGFASKFFYSIKTDEGIRHIHVDQKELDHFQGNLINASIDQIEFQTPSRKDDLIGLCYLLCQLLRRDQLPYVDKVHNKFLRSKSLNESQILYHTILEAKKKISTK